jgi:hypothetical protein
MKLTNWQRIGFPYYYEPADPGIAVINVSGTIYAFGSVVPSGAGSLNLCSSVNVTGWAWYGTAGWGNRHFFGATYHSGKFWIAGGALGSTIYDDVWNSTDFINWTQISTGNSWGKRHGLTLDSFNGKLVLIGGYSGVYNSGSYKGDIYDSSDGITWTLKTQSITPVRCHSTICTGDQYLWIVGGESASGVYVSGYYKISPLGGDYAKQTIVVPNDYNINHPANWRARGGVSLAYDSSYIYVLGGITATGALNDIFYMDKTNTSNGWIVGTPTTSYTHRGFAGCVVYNSGIYLLGGITNSPGASEIIGGDGNPCPGQYYNKLVTITTPVYNNHIVTISGGVITNWVKDTQAGTSGIANYIRTLPVTPNTHSITISGGLIKNWTVNASGTRTAHNHSINISGGLVKSWSVT